MVNDLTDDFERIHVLSLPELMVLILGASEPPRGVVSTRWEDADWQLGSFARAAVARLKKSNYRSPSAQSVYEYLRSNGGSDAPLTRDSDWVSYLRQLPDFEKARGLRAHAALLSVIGTTLARHRSLSDISHVIIDEAQDVTPLEWFLLEAINDGTWTLLGDLNQRRSDHNLFSWQQVLEVLDLTEVDMPIRRLERGYRSTRPILEYANRLLPRAERAVLAFQDSGPTPRVTRVRDSELGSTVDAEVRRLLREYPSGTHAVITPRFSDVRQWLRRLGWAMHDRNVELWEFNGRVVRVVGPNAARGLEYDAVVVVEPTEFPRNLGRQGPLYTSLTRANRELSIIHTKQLPDALRR
ncbi:MAG: hypothetical protein NT132_04330 [Microbacterium sp.]|uniref:hypothetical protein n=1 Tax=Microbacterium sp. TaxID=51671 RepID=UPI0026351F4D|nr:hypothetical protein [Microbacterium sp.]MCX6501625.1 hypothetical protein [Microbacterium sp.]